MSSMKMQPTDQTSIAVVYSDELSSNSGALYHRVTTYSVMNSLSELVRASPKSQILRSQLAFSNRLLGFKSLCIIPAEWMYLRPRRSWYKKYCKIHTYDLVFIHDFNLRERWMISYYTWQCSSDNPWLDRIIWWRSVSISSVPIYTSLNSLLKGGGITSFIAITCEIVHISSINSWFKPTKEIPKNSISKIKSR